MGVVDIVKGGKLEKLRCFSWFFLVVVNVYW